jgi:hypothetical protein
MLDSQEKATFKNVVKDRREVVDGPWTSKIIDFVDEYHIDRIVIRFHVDDDVPHQMLIFKNGEQEASKTIAFEDAKYVASPVSVVGKQEAERIFGVEPTTDSFEDVPQIADMVWKSLGWTVVPDGKEWMGE